MDNLYDNIFNANDECFSQETLQKYLDGKLTPAQTRSVEAHLVDCQICNDLLAGLILMQNSNQNLSDITTELNDTIDKKTAEKTDPKVISMTFKRKMAIAASILLIVTAGILTLMINNQTKNNVISELPNIEKTNGGQNIEKDKKSNKKLSDTSLLKNKNIEEIPLKETIADKNELENEKVKTAEKFRKEAEQKKNTLKPETTEKVLPIVDTNDEMDEEIVLEIEEIEEIEDSEIENELITSEKEPDILKNEKAQKLADNVTKKENNSGIIKNESATPKNRNNTEIIVDSDIATTDNLALTERAATQKARFWNKKGKSKASPTIIEANEALVLDNEDLETTAGAAIENNNRLHNQPQTEPSDSLFFERAMLYNNQNKIDSAIIYLDKIIVNPQSDFYAKACFEKAQLQLKNKQKTEAVKTLELIKTNQQYQKQVEKILDSLKN